MIWKMKYRCGGGNPPHRLVELQEIDGLTESLSALRTLT